MSHLLAAAAGSSACAARRVSIDDFYLPRDEPGGPLGRASWQSVPTSTAAIPVPHDVRAWRAHARPSRGLKRHGDAAGGEREIRVPVYDKSAHARPRRSDGRPTDWTRGARAARHRRSSRAGCSGFRRCRNPSLPDPRDGRAEPRARGLRTTGIDFFDAFVVLRAKEFARTIARVARAGGSGRRKRAGCPALSRCRHRGLHPALPSGVRDLRGCAAPVRRAAHADDLARSRSTRGAIHVEPMDHAAARPMRLAVAVGAAAIIDRRVLS